MDYLTGTEQRTGVGLCAGGQVPRVDTDVLGFDRAVVGFQTKLEKNVGFNVRQVRTTTEQSRPFANRLKPFTTFGF